MNNELKILIFSLNNESYGTDIRDVERILGYEAPTVLPDAPTFVKGVINYEDSILPIVSLSEKFKLGKDKECETRKIIVVKRNDKKFGIIVESVYEVRDVDMKLIEKAPEITNTVERKYINGLVKLEKKIIILLDLDKVLSIEDENKIF